MPEQGAPQRLNLALQGGGSHGALTWGIPLPGAGPLLGMMSHWLSPYQTNPLDINPLRRVLEREVDFEALASARVPQSTTVPQVFVCATNVRTGRGEIFTGKRLSADAVMASACLPLLFKAVEIDGEHYWDGGYSGNPALHPLIYKTDCADVLLVQINPIEHQGVPDSASEIMERMNEVTFNAALQREGEPLRRALLRHRWPAPCSWPPCRARCGRGTRWRSVPTRSSPERRTAATAAL